MYLPICSMACSCAFIMGFSEAAGLFLFRSTAVPFIFPMSTPNTMAGTAAAIPLKIGCTYLGCESTNLSTAVRNVTEVGCHSVTLRY